MCSIRFTRDTRPLRVLGYLLVATLFAGCPLGPGALEFSVTFLDAGGLKQGDPVVYRGVVVGRIADVKIQSGGPVRVDVIVEAKHRAAASREAWYSIEGSAGVGRLTGAKQLLIKDREGTRTPLEPGEVVTGTEGSLEVAVDRLKEAWRDASRAGRELKQTAEEIVREFRDSPETSEFLEDVQRFSSEAERTGREHYREFKDKELPRLKEKAERLKERLERDGKVERAKEFWERFNAWLDETEETGGGEPAPEEKSTPRP